jgi:long-chain acyl-CoA synthetase
VLIVCSDEAAGSSAFLASLLDGMVPVMLSPDSKPDRFKAIFDSIEPAALVADGSLFRERPIKGAGDFAVIEVPDGLRLDTPVAALSRAWRGVRGVLGTASSEADLPLPEKGRSPRLPEVDDSTGYILFTSGTTKSPSGVMISRSALMAQLETLTRLFSYDQRSRLFNATPLAHTDGLVQGPLLAAANGACLLRPGPFSLTHLEEWLDSLGRLGATHFITNPTVLGLIDRYASHDDYFKAEDFFGILSSASILRPQLWDRFEQKFDCRIYNTYGMTETVANATYAGRHPEMGPVGTIGVPVDCEVRLVEVSDGAAGQEPAAEGELQIRGENVFRGYWTDADRTGRTLIGDGWMRTGDLARRRPDGGLEIVGGIKTMINMGGQSVMPEEIDEVLVSHDAVGDVATVGIEDPDFEEVAVAAVVLDHKATEQELSAYCRARLEPLKVPKRILAVDRIPRGDAGKPKTQELRAILAPLLGAAEAADLDVSRGVSAEAVIEMAAEVFHVSARDLDLDSSPSNVDGWDSFNHLNLMINAETTFRVRIPASQIASIRTLGDLHRSINASG